MTFCIWITGLPGSGKSTIAKKFKQLYTGEVEILRLDEIRNALRAEMENPPENYSDEERELIYKKIADVAKEKYDLGTNIIIDATAHKKKWRDYARGLMQNFYEAYVKCPLEIAMQRESNRKNDWVTSNLYKKATAGDENVKELPGVNVPYEEPLNPEIIIESDKVSAQGGAERILESIK